MRNFILLLIICLPLSLFAKHVPVDVAILAGKNYISKRTPAIKNIDLQFLTTNDQLNPSYYIFGLNNNAGFIIVSADDVVLPVLGYSFEGSYDNQNIPPSLIFLLQKYTLQIESARKNSTSANEEIERQWDELLTRNFSPSLKSVQEIAPLLLTNWNQTYPYNALCPEDPAGTGGHVLVGCVAISMVQVMKYYNYPLHGIGSHTHNQSDYGTHTINYANQTYLWNTMPFSLGGTSNFEEAAKLCYHAGVACNMDWGVDGSGAWHYTMAGSLVDHFGYDASCDVVDREDYSSTAWKNMLLGQLDMKRPVVYVGYGESGGHAWNCDGYQGDAGSEMFHMNWGWGGSANGYFTLDNLNPSGMDFNYGQSMVINIFPAVNYPEFCSSQRTYSFSEANFEDGSGNQNYTAGTDCKYLIQSGCGSKVILKFDRFDIAPTDAVMIFDGESTSDPLIAVINGGSSTGEYESTGSEMLLHFIGSSSAYSGWDASYKIEYCNYIPYTYTEPSGSIDDGSKSCLYRNSTNCKWQIQIPGAVSTTLNFTSFDFPEDIDFLAIYKNSMTTANLVEKYTSQNIPVTPLTIEAPLIILRFFTNTLLNADGWSLGYTSIVTGNDENLISEVALSVYPNPFSDDASIQFFLPESCNANLIITDILGRIKYNSSEFLSDGSHTLQFNELLPDDAKGIYFVKLKTDLFSVTRKITKVN